MENQQPVSVGAWTPEAITSIEQQLNQTAMHYGTARREDEINLIEIVRERMMASGLGDRISFYDNNRYIQEAIGKTCAAQQYNLNRWLVLQFMATPHDTKVQRYALIYEINATQWLTIFDKTILPALIDFDLPINI